MQLPIVVTPSKDDPQRGMLGIMRASLPAYQPLVPYYIHWSPEVFMFLLWLWQLSFFIGILNMLPLPILDGGKFVQTLIEKKISEKMVKTVMYSVYAIAFALLGGNILVTALKFGFVTI
jgi:Zn-dependent protease